jgi:glycosyltransferase involved in cell wall biosynthesis
LRLFQLCREGFDQVIACRNRKGDSLHSRLNARLYYRLVNRLVDVKMIDGAGDFRLLSRRAVNALLALKETNRFSKGLFSWIGFPQTYLYYENRERAGGESKWSLRRLLSYGMDGILSFNNRPLRICIWLGGLLVGISALYLLYLLISILMFGVDTPGYFTTLLVITCLGGTQLLSVGIIGEYIGRIYNEVKGRPNYFIKKTNIDRKEEEE